jgi:uncharacterized protein (DUF2252 family)
MNSVNSSLNQHHQPLSNIYERLTAFNKNRLPDMVKLKYKAMSANVFCFFRGTCHLFYEDLAAIGGLPPSPLTWICGDLHLENFGGFRGDDRQEYFDLNDFDEGLLAPAALELVRMVTSIFIAFGNMGLKEDEALETAQMYLNTYALTLTKGKAISIDPRTADGIVHTFLDAVRKRKQKELLKKNTQVKKGKLILLRHTERHFDIEKPLKKELAQFIDDTISNSSFGFHNFKLQDCIFRLAGTGSVGVRRYLLLLKGQDVNNKYLLLDMKQAFTPSLQPYLKTSQPKWGSEAERVFEVQERMQNVSPAMLSAIIFKDEPYLLKQMQPTEDKMNFEVIKDRFKDIDKVINDMAVLTASAQLRSSGRQGSAIADELIVFGKNEEWQKVLLNYALKYSTQVKKYYTEFMAGYKKGAYR